MNIQLWKRPLQPLVSFKVQYSWLEDRPHIDAIARIIYATLLTEWDMILKYQINEDNPEEESINARARLLYEIELLERHLFLVKDIVPEIKKGEKCRYVKIMASFEALAIEAERFRIRMPCAVTHNESFSTDRGIARNIFSRD
jgi:hypothetical protein